jgi:hypothetical protein
VLDVDLLGSVSREGESGVGKDAASEVSLDLLSKKTNDETKSRKSVSSTRETEM